MPASIPLLGSGEDTAEVGADDEAEEEDEDAAGAGKDGCSSSCSGCGKGGAEGSSRAPLLPAAAGVGDVGEPFTLPSLLPSSWGADGVFSSGRNTHSSLLGLEVAVWWWQWWGWPGVPL